jgi:hypothetical protein
MILSDFTRKDGQNRHFLVKTGDFYLPGNSYNIGGIQKKGRLVALYA